MQKNNLFMVMIVALAMVISVPMYLVNSSSDAQSDPPTRASHSPILIQSDSELATSEAVTRGTGSSIDPYIIESWNIDADGSPYGIMITNTTNYLEIRFNQIFGGGGGGGGILLRNVTNVVVLSNAVVDSAGNGIVVRSSRSVSLQFNYIRGHASNGIAVQNSFLLDISDNWIGDGGAGIIMNGTAEARVIHNSILHNDGLGIELASKSAATAVAKNAFVHNNNDGIQANDNGFGNMWFEKDTGNYWSDYPIRYPQAKNDGRVWEFAYVIVAGTTIADWYPLVRPFDDLFPVVSDLDLGVGYTGEPFQYSVKIGDDTYVDYAVARIWTETRELTPAMLWREDIDEWSLQFNLPNNTTETIHVVVTAFDLSGNSGSSNEGMIAMIDDEPPTLVSSTIPEVATTGDPFEIIVEASDNVGIEHIWIEYAVGSDVPEVEEMEKDSTGDYKRTFVAPHVFEQKGRISISLDDGTHNVTVVDEQFDIVDNDAPSIDGGSEDDIIVGDYAIFHAPNATDNIGIANLTWSFIYRGGHVELFGDHFNFTFTEVGDYPITLRASDAAGLYDVAHFKVHVMPAPLPLDLDKDGIPDHLDDDDDGDWWPDETELELGLDPMNASSMPVDTDDDWIPDVKDTDDDCDDVDDDMDAFPLDRTEWSDLDKDGTGDNADLDDDNDTLPDLWELTHGLDPRVAVMPGEDSDDDGLRDIEEFLKGTDPRSTDSDGDGIPDLFEVQNGLDPTKDDSDADSDDDGYTNVQEYMSGTDPKSEASLPKEAGSSGGKDGIAVGAVAGIVIGAVVATLIVAYLSKKGYDYYKAASGRSSNPMYEDKGNSGQNPLHEGSKTRPKGNWDIKKNEKARMSNEDCDDEDCDGPTDDERKVGNGGWDLATNKGGIEESTARKGWDGKVKGSTKVDDDIPQPQGMAINEKGLPGDKPVKKGTKTSAHRTSGGEPNDSDSDNDGLSDGDERKGWDGTVKGSTKFDEGGEAIRESPTRASTGKTTLRESPTRASHGKHDTAKNSIQNMRAREASSGQATGRRSSGPDMEPDMDSRAQDHNSSRSNKTASKHFEDGDIPDEEQRVSDISSGKHTKTGHVTLMK